MAVNFEMVGYGSDGSYVKKLQENLNQKGYNLDVDGKFGPQTLSAVKDYQKKNNLAVDGVVGKNTWGALNNVTSVKPATSTTGDEATDTTKPAAADQTFSYGDYQQSETVTQAQALLQQMMANQPGAYESQWQGQINALMDQILNREDFSYDLNADALYQQYADQYMTQGKLAMMDTMGQAQAMTGGYGNSYAQAVGQQAYQGYLQQLNEVVPELYGMAYDQYQQEGQNLLNQYGVLASQDEQEYGRYRDQVADYQTQLQQAFDQYYTERDYDYSKYTDERNFAYGEFSDNRAYDYQSERDAVADEQWQKEYEESVRQYDEQMALTKEQWDWEKAQYEKESEGTTKSYSGTTNNGKSYNNGSLTNGQVKELQAALGVDADGYYGAASKKAAGGLSAAEAYAKYVGGSDDNPGDNPGDNPSDILDSIKEKAATFTDSDALNDYLTRQYEAGKISEEQMGELYLEYEIPSLQNRNWTLKDDGGTNWFGGIDNNATVTDQYGNTYRLDKLVDALVAEGMGKKEAKEYVKKLQAKLGA